MAGKGSQVQGGGKGSPGCDSSATGVDLRTPPITPTHWTETNLSQAPQDFIVACVYWGSKYPVDYVLKLKRMVEKKLSVKHRFICLSDRDIEGVDCIPIFAKGWSGWWQKVCLFMPDLFPAGTPVLYLDLDVVITGSIDALAFQRTKEPLTMIFNFGPNRSHCAHNSSVMKWTAGDPRVGAIYSLFTSDVMKKLHGDQCWIWRVLRDKVANWPQKMIKSYKYDCRGRDPNGAAVVVFHGDPKPHQCKEDWVRKNWV